MSNNTIVKCKHCKSTCAVDTLSFSRVMSGGKLRLRPICDTCGYINTFNGLWRHDQHNALYIMTGYRNKDYLFFGSSDSKDIDVIHLYNEMPTVNECKILASMLKEEHPNLDLDPNFAVVKKGVVTACFKGTVDEVNNMIYYTYHNFTQKIDCPIKSLLKRNVELKIARVLRGILSFISRTEHRPEVKSALKGSTELKLDTIESIDFSSIMSLGDP